MPARSTLADLIAYVRREIADDSATPTLSDDLIQQVLDQHRRDVFELELTPVETRNATTKQLEKLTFTAPAPFWEAGETLTDAAFTALTAASATNRIEGRYVFATAQTSVLLTGKQFNLFAACADLCELWAAKVAPDVDFGDGTTRFADSQFFAHLMRLAKSFRTRSHQFAGSVGSGALKQSDFESY